MECNVVVWCGVVWCGVVWCVMVWYGMVWYGMVWYVCMYVCYRYLDDPVFVIVPLKLRPNLQGW